MYKDVKRAIDGEDEEGKFKIPFYPLFRRLVRQRSDLSMIVVRIRHRCARDYLIVHLELKTRATLVPHT